MSKIFNSIYGIVAACEKQLTVIQLTVQYFSNLSRVSNVLLLKFSINLLQGPSVF